MASASNSSSSSASSSFENVRWAKELKDDFVDSHWVEETKTRVRRVVADRDLSKHHVVYRGTPLLSVGGIASNVYIAAISLALIEAEELQQTVQPKQVAELYPRTPEQIKSEIAHESHIVDLFTGKPKPSVLASAAASNATNTNVDLQLKIMRNMWMEKGRIRLYAGASYFNHGCFPTCHYQISDISGTITIMTLVDVKKGDELTWSYYGPPPDSEKERKLFFKSKHIVACYCDACQPHAFRTGITQYVKQYSRDLMLAGLKCTHPNCGNVTISGLQCGRCRSVAYCGQLCQRTDWPRHKLTCLSAVNASNATHATHAMTVMKGGKTSRNKSEVVAFRLCHTDRYDGESIKDETWSDLTANQVHVLLPCKYGGGPEARPLWRMDFPQPNRIGAVGDCWLTFGGQTRKLHNTFSDSLTTEDFTLLTRCCEGDDLMARVVHKNHSWQYLLFDSALVFGSPCSTTIATTMSSADSTSNVASGPSTAPSSASKEIWSGTSVAEHL